MQNSFMASLIQSGAIEAGHKRDSDLLYLISDSGSYDEVVKTLEFKTLEVKTPCN